MNEQERIISPLAYDILEKARMNAEESHNPFVTPEHVLFLISSNQEFQKCLRKLSMDPDFFKSRLLLFLSSLPASHDNHSAVMVSASLREALEIAGLTANLVDKKPVGIVHLLIGIAEQRDTLAGYLLRENPEILKEFGVPAFFLKGYSESSAASYCTNRI